MLERLNISQLSLCVLGLRVGYQDSCQCTALLQRAPEDTTNSAVGRIPLFLFKILLDFKKYVISSNGRRVAVLSFELRLKETQESVFLVFGCT